MSLAARLICRSPVSLAGNVVVRANPGDALRRRLHAPPTTARPATSRGHRQQTTPAAGRNVDNHERNKFFRGAFTRVASEDIEQKLGSPFVPPIRDYPSQAATEESRQEAWRLARTQVGFDTIWSQHKDTQHPLLEEVDWSNILEYLQKTTVRMSSDSERIAAMRIVLPANWDLDVSSRSVDFIDSISGLNGRFRLSMDHRNPSAIVVRGESAMLAKVADELLGVRKDVKIFQLGELAESDYETKQLWPAINASVGPGGEVPSDKLGNVWVHREQPEEHWIETRYEDIPRPETWTAEGFESYVTMLVQSRLRPHLALPLYSRLNKQSGRAREQVDTEGIRVGLIMDAFMDPDARPFISAPILNMALSFMARRGGHRASADRLFTAAEEWGVPMDTETFNIMLEGYVTKRDFRYFYMFLRKMISRYFAPNTHTWILFLRLVGNDDLKRQIVVAMYDLNLFANPATSRGVAEAMVSYDAYAAFRSGKKLDDFLRDQKGRYGDGWLSRHAVNGLLREYFRFYGQARPPPAEYAHVVEATVNSGRGFDVSTVNVVMEHCVRDGDWDAAVWILGLAARDGVEPDHRTYDQLIKLAVDTHSPNALAAIFFHGAHEFKLRTRARRALKMVLGCESADEFWNSSKVPIFTKEMAALRTRQPLSNPEKIVPKSVRAIKEVCQGMVPAQTLAVSLAKALSIDRREVEGEGEGEGQLQHLEIEMKSPEGHHDVLPISTMRLDSCFEPDTMIEKSSRPGRRPSFKRYSHHTEEPPKAKVEVPS